MPPPDGDDAAVALARGAQALGLALDDAQRQRLLGYRALLLKWNRVFNLTAVRDEQRMLTHHLLDSLAIVAPLRRHAGGRRLRVLDAGSGAGLPGLVIAIVMGEQAQVCCADAVAKKTSFIRQAAGELALDNVSAVHARVESMAVEPFDVVVSRAFASLADFTSLTRARLASDGVWLAMKGRPPDEEIAALPPSIEVFHVEPLVVPGLDAERCLVWMRPRSIA